MHYLDEIEEYTNFDGFIGPSPCKNEGRTCDNHLLFTAEMSTALIKNTDDHPYLFFETAPTIINYTHLIKDLTLKSGWFSRYPGDRVNDLSPDNLIGYLSLCSKDEALGLLNHALSVKGNIEGSTRTWKEWGEAFTFRFVHMWCLALMKSKRYSNFNPLHLLMLGYSVLYIATSGITDNKKTNADTRKLCYLFMVQMGHYSKLCKISEKIWWKRLRRQYGSEGMRAVYSSYFSPSGQPAHPLSQLAVNAWET